jgi:hypothetical protein
VGRKCDVAQTINKRWQRGTCWQGGFITGTVGGGGTRKHQQARGARAHLLVVPHKSGQTAEDGVEISRGTPWVKISLYDIEYYMLVK